MTSPKNATHPAEVAGDPPTRDIRKSALHPDFWYPVAKSKDLKTGKALGVRFSGEPIVVVRPKNGAAFALEDRCAHRQVPLHVGEVEGESVKCGYHGWSYGKDGTCTAVPYIDLCTMKPNCVRSYPCREAYGLVFVFPGDKDKADSVAFPEIPSADDPNYKTRYLDGSVDCHWSFMHENLMDMNHQFLHRRIMGGIKTIFLGVRHGANWVEADYSFKRASGKQPLGEKFILGKRPEADPGDRDLMTVRTEYPYQTLRFSTAGSEYPVLDLWNVYIPLDKDQRSHHTYSLIMIRRAAIPGLTSLLWPVIVWFTKGIFAEDRWICELEQAAFDAQGEDQNQEIFPAILELRRVLIENGRPIER
jgi:phenylpropionate dioxygenase-like ring-hydroxylating dioxygenase large terminal subunit